MEGGIGGVDDYILGGREERNESNEKKGRERKMECFRVRV